MEQSAGKRKGGRSKDIPQPHPSRITPFEGHPAVVGVKPTQDDLVIHTAARWSRALGGAHLHLAWACPKLIVVEEFPDGSVRTAPVDPDSLDESWLEGSELIKEQAERLLDPYGIPWSFHLLGGRPDRAMTHLARAVDAALYIVGARPSARRRSFSSLLEGPVASHLSHHQHRPVLVVPTQVVDWEDRSPWR